MKSKNNKKRSYCACSMCGLLFSLAHHLSCSFYLSPEDGSLQTEILSKKAVKPKTTTTTTTIRKGSVSSWIGI